MLLNRTTRSNERKTNKRTYCSPTFVLLSKLLAARNETSVFTSAWISKLSRTDRLSDWPAIYVDLLNDLSSIETRFNLAKIVEQKQNYSTPRLGDIYENLFESLASKKISTRGNSSKRRSWMQIDSCDKSACISIQVYKYVFVFCVCLYRFEERIVNMKMTGLITDLQYASDAPT